MIIYYGIILLKICYNINFKLKMKTRKDLILKTVPIETDSYSPVPNKIIFDTVDEQLYKRGLVISNENFITDRALNKVIGCFDIKHPDSSEIGMRLAFRNSYDKSMTAAFVAGNNVWVCQNGCISGEMKFVRKHTGNVLNELKEAVVNSIERLEERFAKIIYQSEKMKSIEVSPIEASELYGKLFFYDKVITLTQLGIIQRELENSTFKDFNDNSLWSIYNHGTFALKESHPLDYIDSHIKYHTIFEKTYNL